MRHAHNPTHAPSAVVGARAAPQQCAAAAPVERLVRCSQSGEMVAICGDYDADGMTSTALLVGVLQRLGARPQAAIPSRMDDGYGLNAAMVERLAAEGKTFT